VARWDFTCIDHETAHVDQHYANGDLFKPTGWNRYLSTMTSQGWEPVTFIAPSGVIAAVCFRRPAAAPAPARPSLPPPAPGAPGL